MKEFIIVILLCWLLLTTYVEIEKPSDPIPYVRSIKEYFDEDRYKMD